MAPNRPRSNSNAYAQNQRTNSNSPNLSRAGYRNQQQHRQQHAFQQQRSSPMPTARISTPQRAFQTSTSTTTATTTSSVSAAAADTGMSPGSRYNQNLKVLRRLDPTIVSIFDQFSHVCLYHHDGVKWEKKGYEGSMFLFERESAPKYGFFILNRMGMHDYIQCINPSDDMAIVGEYLMYRSHTPHTRANRGSTRATNNNNGMATTSEDETADEHHQQQQQQQGQAEVIGLWTLGTDAREPLSTVMMRLHKYVKLGQPYPEEYRHDLGRRLPEVNLAAQKVEEDVFGPRPGSSSSRGAGAAGLQGVASRGARTMVPSKLGNGNVSIAQSPQPATQPSVSELDKLFAKLGGPAQAVPVPTPPPVPTVSAPVAPATTTADSILEMLKNSAVRQQPAAAAKPLLQTSSSLPQITNQPPPQQSQQPTGKALLDSIFASVVPSVSAPSIVNNPPTAMLDAIPLHLQTSRLAAGEVPTSESIIYSPKPSSAVLPQILTADVIHELMGMPSRSESSTSSSYSPSSTTGVGLRRNTNKKDKDRGYIADRGEDDGLSESSTGFEASIDAEADERLANSRVAATSISRSTFLSAGSTSLGSGNVKGDATPRARSERGLEPVKVQQQQREVTEVATKTSNRRTAERTASESTITTFTAQSSNAGRVVFQSGSELWPHERPSTQGSSIPGTPSKNHSNMAPVATSAPTSAPAVMANAQHAHGGSVNSDEGLVELDFSEIGVLDDMKAFEAKREEAEAEAGSGSGAPMSRRAKARAKSQAVGVGVSGGAGVGTGTALPASPSGKIEGKAKRGKKEASTPIASVAQVNGVSAQPSVQPSQSSSEPTINGTKTSQNFSDIAQDVLLKTALESGLKATTPAMDKNVFVREVLTLVHTDQSFVNKLYESYLKSVASA